MFFLAVEKLKDYAQNLIFMDKIQQLRSGLIIKICKSAQCIHMDFWALT
jgi:hypothetical protein